MKLTIDDCHYDEDDKETTFVVDSSQHEEIVKHLKSKKLSAGGFGAETTLSTVEVTGSPEDVVKAMADFDMLCAWRSFRDNIHPDFGTRGSSVSPRSLNFAGLSRRSQRQ
jgi:hypothetical protein